MTKIVPVILCGGAGSRLWPLSRESLPKPFVSLFGGRSLLAATLDRVTDRRFWTEPIILAQAENRFLVSEALDEVGLEGRIALEPERRDTAGAVAAAAALVASESPEAVIMILPADHVVPDRDQIRNLAARGRPAAEAGRIVTFGIKPTRGETAYGYIQPKRDGESWGEARRVARFVEKPDSEAAAAYVADGYFWNSGIFLMSAAAVLGEIARCQPEITNSARGAVSRLKMDPPYLWLDQEAWATMPNIAFDRAVMERTGLAAVVEADLDWSDVGNWHSVWQISDKDASGNVAVGKVHVLDSRRTYARSLGPVIGAIGVDDMAIVASDNAVLVTPLERAADIKRLVDDINQSDADTDAGEGRVYRPWGYFDSVDRGNGHQVKRICVKPGARLSLQKHRHRSEHWVVVAGTALVTCGERIERLQIGQTAFIPCGSVHRLENPGDSQLEVIEVQLGAYLGEDDIIRIEDDYQRS